MDGSFMTVKFEGSLILSRQHLFLCVTCSKLEFYSSLKTHIQSWKYWNAMNIRWLDLFTNE
jgi:hypothetical protein